MADGSLLIRQLFAPGLPPKVLETSRIDETNETYSGYMR